MMKIRSKSYRDAARDQQCTLQILGVCNHDPATTVLAHLPSEGKGVATKVDDTSAVDACSACHDCIDGRRPWPEGEKQYRDWYLLRALQRTVKRRALQGVITIKGMKL